MLMAKVGCFKLKTTPEVKTTASAGDKGTKSLQ
jgi:hypothetical protein